MARELSPYVEIERSAWADLADDVPQPLTEDDVQRLKGLGEELDIDEVRQGYLPRSLAPAPRSSPSPTARRISGECTTRLRA